MCLRNRQESSQVEAQQDLETDWMGVREKVSGRAGVVIPLQRGDSRAHACGMASSLPTADIEAGCWDIQAEMSIELDTLSLMVGTEMTGVTEVEVPSTSNPIHKADVCVCETPVRPSKAAAMCGFIMENRCRPRQRCLICNWVGI